MDKTATALLGELEHIETSHQRRLEIAELLDTIGDPRPGVGVIEGLPDIEWLPVSPGGKATITRVWEAETPEEETRVTHIQEFDVKSFYVAKYLVTHAQYQAFIKAVDGYDDPRWWQDVPEPYQRQALVEQRTQRFNNPRDSLSWYQCVAFGRWMNYKLRGFDLPLPSGTGALRVGENAQIRLPAEWEWQWAAQNGAEARPYPWGQKNSAYTNTRESNLSQAVAVGMYPHGAAACGALDMCGNLMEWCANDKQNLAVIDVRSTASKALRGGDWGYSIDIAACGRADDEVPERIDPLNGFRLIVGSVQPYL